MNYFLDIFVPPTASDPVRWYRYAQAPSSDSAQGSWDAEYEAEQALRQWCQTDTIRLYIPGEWVSVWLTELPVLPARQIPHVLPAILEDDLNQDIDELHFSALRVEDKRATVAVIHQSRMRDVLDWLHMNGITRATVAPDWMSIPEGHMVIQTDRCLTRIDACRGWSACMELAPEMLRTQYREHSGPFQFVVVGDTTEKVSGWIDSRADGVRLVHNRILSERGQPEGNLLSGKWQPRISYNQQWTRWRPFVLPVLFTLCCLTLERGIALWSTGERLTQSRTKVEQLFLILFPEQKRIINLRSQVNISLKNHPSHAKGNDLTTLLPLIAKTIKSTSLTEVEVREITFDRQRQTLQLQLRTRHFASFETLRAAFTTHFRVQQDALQKENGYVTGAIILNRKQNVTH